MGSACQWIHGWCNTFQIHRVEQSLTSLTDRVLACMLPSRSVHHSDRTFESVTSLFLDVIKSRVQLRATPPSGTPVQYIAHEFRAILAESGTYVAHLYLWVSLEANRQQSWLVSRLDTIMCVNPYLSRR